MHICTAYIMLGGDHGSVVYRGPDNPVSWPEIGVLQTIHGQDCVFNIEVIDELVRHRAAEKLRLQRIYGDGIVEAIYPGRSAAIEMQVPGYEPKKRGRKATTPRDPDADEFEPETSAEYADTDLVLSGTPGRPGQPVEPPIPIPEPEPEGDPDDDNLAQANFEAVAASKTKPPRNRTTGPKGVLVTSTGDRIPLGKETL